jgi:hypothetical protein
MVLRVLELEGLRLLRDEMFSAAFSVAVSLAKMARLQVSNEAVDPTQASSGICIFSRPEIPLTLHW